MQYMVQCTPGQGLPTFVDVPIHLSLYKEKNIKYLNFDKKFRKIYLQERRHLKFYCTMGARQKKIAFLAGHSAKRVVGSDSYEMQV